MTKTKEKEAKEIKENRKEFKVAFDPLNILTIEEEKEINHTTETTKATETIANETNTKAKGTSKTKTKTKTKVKAKVNAKGNAEAPEAVVPQLERTTCQELIPTATPIHESTRAGNNQEWKDFELEDDENEKQGNEKEMNNFVFHVSGGLDFEKIGWDFTTAKLSAKKSLKNSTLDSKIAKKRLQNQETEFNGEENDKDIDDNNIDINLVDIENSELQTTSNDKIERSQEQENHLKDIVHDKRIAEYFDTEPIPVDSSLDQPDSFNSLSISRPILKAIAAMGFVKPTDVQARTIPIALQGRDICASAVTGSGKTAAFMIPILERLLFRPKSSPAIRVLVLVPTRELGAQCHSVSMSLSKFSTIQVCLCVGGLSSKQQESALQQKPDIVIATPGRLIDHIHNARSFTLDELEILVMDEADRMLEDGFQAELEEIIKHTPVKRQTMLFSATMTDNIDKLIQLSLNKPVRLFVDSAEAMTTRLVQEFIRIRQHRENARQAILAALCSRTYKTKTLVFFRSKQAAHLMKVTFGLLGMKAAELHGNLTQLQRLEALEQFRDGHVDFLMATDVASRGLDISGIKTVINYEMPATYQVYIHRCGRTARGDAAGRAVSLVGEADRGILKLALKNSKDAVKHRVIPGPVLARFEGLVKDIQKSVAEILAEEKEDKLMDTAEMEIRKAQNQIDHEDEIKARPARVWFQTAIEKEAAKALKKVEKESGGVKRGKMDGLSRRKKRLFQAREEDKQVDARQKVAAKKAKASVRPGKLTQFRPESGEQKTKKGGKRIGSAFENDIHRVPKKRK